MQKSKVLILTYSILLSACGGDLSETAAQKETITDKENIVVAATPPIEDVKNIKDTDLPECISKILDRSYVASLINTGSPYEDLRPKLVEAGLTPDLSDEYHMCKGEPEDRSMMAKYYCDILPETSNCWSTGMGGCEFLWTKDNMTFAFRTFSDEREEGSLGGYIVDAGCGLTGQ